MAFTRLVCSLLVIAALVHSAAAQTTHTVGDSSGWTIVSSGYSNWSASQTFRVGDSLVFNFDTGAHDVLTVSKAAFEACNDASPIATVSTGPATITLTSEGEHYYICGFTGHCSAGQKLSVKVTGTTGSPPPSTTPASPSPSATPPSTTASPPPSTTASPSPSTTPASPSPSATPPSTTASPPPSTTASPSPSTTPASPSPSAAPPTSGRSPPAATTPTTPPSTTATPPTTPTVPSPKAGGPPSHSASVRTVAGFSAILWSAAAAALLL